VAEGSAEEGDGENKRKGGELCQDLMERDLVEWVL